MSVIKSRQWLVYLYEVEFHPNGVDFISKRLIRKWPVMGGYWADTFEQVLDDLEASALINPEKHWVELV